MACPRCQIETPGTRLCNHCFKTRNNSNPLETGQQGTDRPVSWQLLRKNDPHHRGFQSSRGIQTVRRATARTGAEPELNTPFLRMGESPQRTYGSGILWISGNRWVGLGLMIFIIGQLFSIGAFLADSFGVWCTGNMLSVMGVAVTMLSACNTGAFPGRRLAPLATSRLKLSRRSSKASNLSKSS